MTSNKSNDGQMLYFHGTESDSLELIKKTGLKAIRSQQTKENFSQSRDVIWVTESLNDAHLFGDRALRNKAELLSGFDANKEFETFEEVFEQDNRLREAKNALRAAILRFSIPNACEVEVRQETGRKWKKLTQCEINPLDMEICFDPNPEPRSQLSAEEIVKLIHQTDADRIKTVRREDESRLQRA